MGSENKTPIVAPSWYFLERSADGAPFTQLPSRATGEQIFLTTFQPADNLAMAAILSDTSLNDKLISVPKPYTVADADFWIALQLSGRGNLPLQVLRSGSPQTGTFIGVVSLTQDDVITPPTQSTAGLVGGEYEIGYYLHPNYHKMGIMRDAVLAALTWAIMEAGVKDVVVNAEELNTGSVKLIESIPELKKSGEIDILWPEHKGGGIRRILTWRWHCND